MNPAGVPVFLPWLQEAQVTCLEEVLIFLLARKIPGSNYFISYHDFKEKHNYLYTFSDTFVIFIEEKKKHIPIEVFIQHINGRAVHTYMGWCHTLKCDWGTKAAASAHSISSLLFGVYEMKIWPSACSSFPLLLRIFLRPKKLQL